MNIEEFVSETIVQITTGVAKSCARAGSAGAKVNPSGLGWTDGKGRLVYGDGHLVEEVEFDIAVTVSEEKASSGKLGLSVASIGAGMQGQTTSANSTISRIKFSVPVKLPNG